MSEEQVDEWLEKYDVDHWIQVDDRLDKDHLEEVDNAIADVIYDAGDQESYDRDPYAYYGLRRSDF
jgi:hypothetical protein